jgi:hypothetical protein
MNKLNSNENDNNDAWRVNDEGFDSSDHQVGQQQDQTSPGDSPRRAELRWLTAASGFAENTHSIEVMRPSQTNCPDGGHDIDIVGNADEVIPFLGLMTGKPLEELDYVRQSAQGGKLMVRLDVKSGATISADTIDKHVVHSNRSPDFHGHVLVCTHPDPQITKSAQLKLDEHAKSFKEDGKFFGIARLAGLERIENVIGSITLNRPDQEI